MRSTVLTHTLAALVTFVATACGPNGVTANKLEGAFATTFANLVHVQEAMLGGPPVEAAALRTTATCRKNGAAHDATGGGSWRCTVTWFAPVYRTPLVDTYDLSVTMDGCYTATADGAEAHIGGPTLQTFGGARVTNLLYAFDGCFDTR